MADENNNENDDNNQENFPLVARVVNDGEDEQEADRKLDEEFAAPALYTGTEQTTEPQAPAEEEIIDAEFSEVQPETAQPQPQAEHAQPQTEQLDDDDLLRRHIRDFDRYWNDLTEPLGQIENETAREKYAAQLEEEMNKMKALASFYHENKFKDRFPADSLSLIGSMSFENRLLGPYMLLTTPDGSAQVTVSKNGVSLDAKAHTQPAYDLMASALVAKGGNKFKVMNMSKTQKSMFTAGLIKQYQFPEGIDVKLDNGETINVKSLRDLKQQNLGQNEYKRALKTMAATVINKHMKNVPQNDPRFLEGVVNRLPRWELTTPSADAENKGPQPEPEAPAPILETEQKHQEPETQNIGLAPKSEPAGLLENAAEPTGRVVKLANGKEVTVYETPYQSDDLGPEHRAYEEKVDLVGQAYSDIGSLDKKERVEQGISMKHYLGANSAHNTINRLEDARKAILSKHEDGTIDDAQKAELMSDLRSSYKDMTASLEGTKDGIKKQFAQPAFREQMNKMMDRANSIINRAEKPEEFAQNQSQEYRQSGPTNTAQQKRKPGSNGPAAA